MQAHSPDPAIDSPLAWGTVGWPSDSATSFYSLGDSKSGVTLVNVTLFRGRNPAASELDHSVAQGHEITCQLGGTFFGVPPQGTRVLVAVPEPGGLTPGGSTIQQAVDPRGIQIFGTPKPGDWCISYPGCIARIIGKANGSISIVTTADGTPSGKTLSLYFGPDAFRVTHTFGTLAFDSTGITMSIGGAALTMKPGGIARLLGKLVSVQGKLAAIAGTISTCIGDGAMPTGVPGVTPGPTSALYGAAAVVGAPGSHNVFIAP